MSSISSLSTPHSSTPPKPASGKKKAASAKHSSSRTTVLSGSKKSSSSVRVVPAPQARKRSPQVPSVGAMDLEGDRKIYKGREFILRRVNKARRWVQVHGPPLSASSPRPASPKPAARRPASPRPASPRPASPKPARRQRRSSSLRRTVSRRRKAAAQRRIAAFYRQRRVRNFSKIPGPKVLKQQGMRVGQRLRVGDRMYRVGEQPVANGVILRAFRVKEAKKPRPPKKAKPAKRRQSSLQREEAAAFLQALGLPKLPEGKGKSASMARSVRSLKRKLESLKRPIKAAAAAVEQPKDVVLGPSCLAFVLKASCRKRLCGMKAKSRSRSKSKSRSRSKSKSRSRSKSKSRSRSKGQGAAV
jgi:hypothetical protein